MQFVIFVFVIGGVLLAVLGLGYVGLPLAVAFANAGHRVTGYDIDEIRLRKLEANQSPVETVDNEQLIEIRNQVTYTSDHSDLSDCTSYFICVPTPLAEDRSPDLGAIKLAAQTIAPYLLPGDLVVLESTSHPGTTEDLLGGMLAELSGLAPGIDFHLSFSPERVDPGNQLYGIRNTPKIVSGLTSACREAASHLYSSICDEVVLADGIREAELSKLLENTYRQVNIALVNELAKVSREMGIDLHEAIRCAATKPFGFQEFQPGPGVGGHCIPVDPMFLYSEVKARTGIDLEIVRVAQEVNDSMPNHVVARIEDELRRRGSAVKGARVALLGVGYKTGSMDMRKSPAESVAALLMMAGAEIFFVDSRIDQFVVKGIEVLPISIDELSGVDVTVLINTELEFLDSQVIPAGGFCLDTRGAFDLRKYPKGSVARL